MRSLRAVLVALFFTALGIVALRDVIRLGSDLPWHVMYDFPDFYCAGGALDEHASPYTYEPLRTCEHAVNPAPSFKANAGVAIPAPQPPYAFPIFMGLAKIDFGAARAIYAAAILLAVVLSAAILTRLDVPFDVALLALALSAGYLQIDAGQITPFVLLATIAAGSMLAERRDSLAGFFGALTAVEPHLGISVVIALLLFVPRARWSLIATGAGLMLWGVAVGGFSVFSSYVTRVIPEQGAAEIAFPPQYSLTHLLHEFGMADGLALQLGAISIIVLLAVGLLLAQSLSMRLGRRELVVFLPSATVVMAGVYVHAIELCFAIPAALILAYRAPGAWRVVAAIALALLAIPWILVWGFKKLWMASVFIVAALLYRLRVPAAAGIATVVAVATLIYVLERNPPWLPSAAPASSTSYTADTLVQAEWADVASGLDDHDPLWLYVKIPGWCALAAILVVAAMAARHASAKPADSAQGDIDSAQGDTVRAHRDLRVARAMETIFSQARIFGPSRNRGPRKSARDEAREAAARP